MGSDASDHPDHQFPNTRWSVVLQAQGSDSAMRHRALEQICSTYWLPIYAFARGQGLAPASFRGQARMALTLANASWARGNTGDGGTSYGMQFRATFQASLRDVERSGTPWLPLRHA